MYVSPHPDIMQGGAGEQITGVPRANAAGVRSVSPPSRSQPRVNYLALKLLFWGGKERNVWNGVGRGASSGSIILGGSTLRFPPALAMTQCFAPTDRLFIYATRVLRLPGF